jgi:hypothetical protein
MPVAIRKEELGKLFDNVYYEIFAIADDNEKLAKSIRETLKQHQLGNFLKSWKRNAKELEQWTPFHFLRGIENALAPVLRTKGREPRASFRGARDVPRVNWANVLSKTTKAMKVTPHRETGEDQERKDAILDSLENLIHERRHKLAAGLMNQRDSIVQAWKDELAELDRLNQQAQA